MTSYLPASSFPAWSVDKFAEAPSVPLPSSSNTPPHLSTPLPCSPQPSTPSSHALPSTPPLPSSNAAAATGQPWAQPTISTFSTSASLHIVQPYLQNESDSTDSVKQSGLRLSGVSNRSDNRPRRPANAWILYRSDKMKVLKPTEPSAPRRTQADISKLIAEMWKHETEDVKKYYETLSDLAKAEHHAQYPTYRFQPAKKADKARGQKKAQKAALRSERGTNARRVVPSAIGPLQELSVNAQLEPHSVDDALTSGHPLQSDKSILVFPSTPNFAPYVAAPRSRSSATREARRSTGRQSLAESHGVRPTLPPLITSFPMSSTASSMPGETVSSETSTQFVHHWPEQSSSPTTLTQYTAHSDRSYSDRSPITTNHEQSSAAPTGWTPSNTSYEYSLDPAQPAGPGFIPTEPQSLSQASSDPFLNLFTHPGASVEVALPADFDFNLPELGEFDAFQQWFGPGGLDIAGYPSFSDPGPFPQQPSHPLPQDAMEGHGLIKQEESTRPTLQQSSDTRGALAYPTPPSCSPPTTLMPIPRFPQVAAPLKTEHSGLYSSTPPATCHFVGHQQGWESYQPVAPA